MTQFLWIPGKLPGLNEIIRERGRAFGKGRKRSDGYAKLKHAWAERIEAHARAQRFRPVDFAAFSYLFVEAERRRDPSNVIAGGLKLIEDALQEAELLAGDGWANVTAIAPFWALGDPPGVLVACGDVVLTKAELVERYQKPRAA